MKRIFKSFLLSSLLLGTGCAKVASSSLDNSAKTAAGAIGCANMKSKVFDSMYSYLDTEQAAPDLSSLTSNLNGKIDQIVQQQKIDNPEVVAQLKKNISDLYQTLIEQSAQLKQTKSAKEHLQTIIELEMGDTSTPENVQLNSVVAKQFSNIQNTASQLDVQCSSGSSTNSTASVPSTTPGSTTGSPSSPSSSSSTLNSTGVLTGSHNVFATAYQSCTVLDLPDMSAATPNVVGIERYGTASDGIGGLRRIASLSEVQDTDYYIKVAGGAQAGCFNVRSNPLIYDYGGQAAVSNNVIDFSQNAGSGTSALGVDCSAYVSAAIAAGGLRYQPGVDNKAIYIRQTSTKFINAAQSGFTCFQNVTMTPTTTMQAGDIVAVHGHVLLIDRVGSDPFGLANTKTSADCNSLSISNFDFTVSQSSPSKGGIGLNHYMAKDYLNESSLMKAAFLSFAQSACQARFSNASIATASSSYGILRHKGTPECISPKIQMANQSCVSQCLQ